MIRPVRRERGYALLAVLFFGAVMAIMLGLSLPRAAFEAQRAKEDDLMYRGGQYARAVQLFYRKNKRYPAKLEDLEKTNNVRFLRRKYEDPITKKDEWRFIHIGPAGMFTDSLVYDKPKPKKEGEPGSAGSAPGSGFPDMGTGSTTTGAPPVTGMADRLRAGGAQPPPGTDPNAFPGVQPPPGGQPGYFNQPAVVAGQPGAYPPGAGGAVPVYGQPYPGPQAYAGQPSAGQQYPGQQYPGQQYAAQQYPPQQYPPQQYPGQPYPGQPGAQAFPAGGFPGAPPGVVRGVPGGAPGFAAPGGAFGASPNPIGGAAPAVGSEAARIIGQLLTTPRPGGLAGIQGGGAQAGFSLSGGAAGSAGFGGGIAGVASKSEARGIKVYQERETYNEWEFVYDYRRDTMLMGGVPGMAGGLPGQTGGQVPTHSGQPGMGGSSGSAFGGGAFGGGGLGGGGFGQTGFGQPGAGQPGFGQTGFGQPGFGQPGFGQPGFGQPGFGQPGQGPIAPINPAQPGLPGSPFGPPRSGAPGPR